ncbi:MAG: FGGY-family carbohydrate kinase [Thiobacillaceae bacterium]
MFFLGLDFGTSGARAAVLDKHGVLTFESSVSYADSTRPQDWRVALFELITRVPDEIRASLSALVIDATSGTLLATNPAFEPVSPALLYNDQRAAAEAIEICAQCPAAAAGKTPPLWAPPGLARRVWLAHRFPAATHCFHQADWLTTLLSDVAGITDYHNALKCGYDVEKLAWPAWVTALPGGHWQQSVLAPGASIGRVSASVARRFQIDPACVVCAGTTDSIAAFIASGCDSPGEAVTSLGTTLALKLLSRNRVEDYESGVYSHRFGKLWLVGGASNTGGGVLKQYFSDGDLAALSAQINPDYPTTLDYYPLVRAGERFPINDSELMPRMEPRPGDDVAFLQGLLEGMARIEARGYAKLQGLGASPLVRVMTAGGGRRNDAWRRIREKTLGVPVRFSEHGEAAVGAAMLARSGGQSLGDC